MAMLFVVIVHLCQTFEMSLPLMKCYVHIHVGCLVDWLAYGHCSEYECIWQMRVNSTLLTFNKHL